jgi:predicted amidohydrolase
MEGQDGTERFRAAAVQDTSVWLEREASTEKACALIEEAGRNGANVVALPESFIPGFPYWVFVKPLSETASWHVRLHEQAVEIPGAALDALAAAAGRAGVYAVVGITEREPGTIGTLYNTNVVLSPDGTYVGKHRKLVPTWGERAVWTGGDGSTLSVFPTPFGPLGTLNCGENLNTLARYALLAQGERIHGELSIRSAGWRAALLERALPARCPARVRGEALLDRQRGVRDPGDRCEAGNPVRGTGRLLQLRLGRRRPER